MNLTDDCRYSREEVIRLRDQRPARGPLCSKCQSHIPQFEDLSVEDTERLRHLSTIERVKEVMRLTGCSLVWGKIWALHPHGPNDRDPERPCPYCREPLRTKTAQQCRHCKLDWHDPDNVVFLA